MKDWHKLTSLVFKWGREKDAHQHKWVGVNYTRKCAHCHENYNAAGYGGAWVRWTPYCTANIKGDEK
jgi:hypothetical protein